MVGIMTSKMQRHLLDPFLDIASVEQRCQGTGEVDPSIAQALVDKMTMRVHWRRERAWERYEIALWINTLANRAFIAGNLDVARNIYAGIHDLAWQGHCHDYSENESLSTFSDEDYANSCKILDIASWITPVIATSKYGGLHGAHDRVLVFTNHIATVIARDQLILPTAMLSTIFWLRGIALFGMKNFDTAVQHFTTGVTFDSSNGALREYASFAA